MLRGRRYAESCMHFSMCWAKRGPEGGWGAFAPHTRAVPSDPITRGSNTAGRTTGGCTVLLPRADADRL